MKKKFVEILICFVLLFAMLYVSSRVYYFLKFAKTGPEKILTMGLLFAELFILIQTFGYFINLFFAIAKRISPFGARKIPNSISSYPPVAVLVCSYKEPLEVIEDTLTCFHNLSYPNKFLYLLDDTRYELGWGTPEEKEKYKNDIEQLCKWTGVNLFRRKWRGAKAGIINDFLKWMHGEDKKGFQFYPYQNTTRVEVEKYLVIFDADMNPLPDFVERLVAYMDAYPNMGFVQTPQYYSNFETNRVARISGLQQAVFYEYICEGKGVKNAIFCCGTNVIMRTKALWGIGGFNENSVTEDLETSFELHRRGWISDYFNRVCAFGMGPMDLGSYFSQQYRWALGCIGLFRKLIINFIFHPLSMSPILWWEYLLTTTHYLIGWVFFILMLCPMLFLYLGIPSYFLYPQTYFVTFIPYVVLTFWVYLWTLLDKRYPLRELIFGMYMYGVNFPIYMRASVPALLGYKGTFKVTSKKGSEALPWWQLWPQLTFLFANLGAVIWGLMRLYNERTYVYAIAVNVFWCFFHFCIISIVIYINQPEESS